MPKRARNRRRGSTAVATRAPDPLPPAALVPHLAPEALHQLIRHRGLDVSGELIAAATPEQLTAIFDIDVWRAAASGHDEQLDVNRFGEWIEALVESGDDVAARTIAALDAPLVIAALSRYVRVFDPATLAVPIDTDDEWPDVPAPGELSREVGGYVVRARRTDTWDAIVALLLALEELAPDRFQEIMRGCRRLSNSTPEIDGLDDLLGEPAQVLHDVGVDRDHRRVQLGYVTAADARAFLQMARQPHSHAASSSANPIVAAYFRAAADAGDHSQPPRAQLTGATAEPVRETRAGAEPRPAADADPVVLDARSRELAFLANALMAGGSVLSRAFTPREASEAAIAICQLGVASRPTIRGVSVDDDLIAAFEIGWTTLHELSLFVARQLIDALTHLRCADPAMLIGLSTLRRELVRHSRNGTPWLVHDALDVIATLDVPICSGLEALLSECPVLSDAVTAILDRRTSAIDPAAFQFISRPAQVRQVRTFASMLLGLLTRA